MPISTKTQYDIIILGAGIAGLNAAYEILKRSPNSRLLVIEKEKILGGRVHTYTDKYMSVEAGAGRLHSGQKHAVTLIGELGLSDHLIPIGSGDFGFFDVGREGREGEMNSAPNRDIVLKLIQASHHENVSELRAMSLLDFASKVLEDHEIKCLCDSFGYYTELVLMNAHDSLSLISGHLSADHKYMVLRGGLSQVIENLAKRVLDMGGEIKTNCCCLDIDGDDTGSGYILSCKHGGGRTDIFENLRGGGVTRKKSRHANHTRRRHVRIGVYYAKKVICALPKQVLETFAFFRPVWPDLHHIVCEPLCRIYSKFPLDDDGRAWFHDLSKFTTNNNLRIVIPIDSSNGVIMSSYTDYKFARFWKKLYGKKSGGGGGSRARDIRAVNKELVRLLGESTGIESIPTPIKTIMFYWPCGVGYWGVGADSHEISRKLVRPFSDKDIFICGEHFSEKNQQWIEGALETSHHISDLVCM